ncbi:hypothetical protein DY000_02004602 [Brassica cretica]|uniref:Uncharacterized protein n=1 Tax=Brassica cretica TaxID=69181 RepID=A0ABQ7C387_BRACR|nr:hypothetical protein DY000_02004602 [Brassica cretica]
MVKEPHAWPSFATELERIKTLQICFPDFNITHCADEKYANVKWEELGFGFYRTDNMYVAKCKHGESFQEGSIVPYADFQISPCSAVLNYGQVSTDH